MINSQAPFLLRGQGSSIKFRQNDSEISRRPIRWRQFFKQGFFFLEETTLPGRNSRQAAASAKRQIKFHPTKPSELSLLKNKAFFKSTKSSTHVLVGYNSVRTMTKSIKDFFFN